MQEFHSHSQLKTSLWLSFSLVIFAFLGSLLLAIPIFTRPGVDASYFDHLITSISLVSVSGLAALPIGPTYNMAGQLICLFLIQVGGLGVITILNFGLFTMRRRISLKDQIMIQEAMGRNTNRNFLSFLSSIYRFTLTIELIGAAIIMTDFVPRYGWLHGTFNAFFLSVSAFSNSGFHNLGYNSLEGFSFNPLILLTTSTLVIIGGIGFIVWFEIIETIKTYFHNRPHSWRLAFRKLSIHARLVINTTLIITLLGTLLIFFIEIQNNASMVGFSRLDQLLNSFFTAVNARTAGYASINYEELMPATKFSMMTQTIIGGAPGGTAGGIKVTSFAIVCLLFRSELRNYNQVVIYQRIIPNHLVKKALVIIVFFTIMLFAGFGLLLVTQPHIDSFDLLFEAVSAIGTSGISLNTTDLLTPIGQLIIIIMMIAGRVGPITLLMGILQTKTKEIHYAQTNVHLG